MSVLSLSQYLPAKLWKAQPTAVVNVPKARPEPIEAQLIIEEPAPRRCSKRRKLIQDDSQRSPGLLDLPQELVLDVAELLSSADLAFFDLTCRALRLGAKLEPKWKSLYEAEFNGAAKDTAATSVQQRAATLAGGWKELYKCRLEKDREVKAAAAPGETPWEQPCKWELQVALERLTAMAPAGSRGLGTSIMFLLDGSGSVTEDDFRTMTSFIGAALQNITSSHPLARVGILQFSNDVRVELPPQVVEQEVFDKKLETMTRINGGTNISLAISKAGQLLKAVDAEVLQASLADPAAPAAEPFPSKVLVLLTDGRVDAYQAHEARNMMERLADEQANVSLHAFGVGRGVDKVELLHIISACSKGDPEDCYMGLRVLDEHPW